MGNCPAPATSACLSKITNDEAQAIPIEATTISQERPSVHSSASGGDHQAATEIRLEEKPGDEMVCPVIETGKLALPVGEIPPEPPQAMFPLPRKSSHALDRSCTMPDCEVCQYKKMNMNRMPTARRIEGYEGNNNNNQSNNNNNQSNNLSGTPSSNYMMAHNNSSDGTPLNKAVEPLTIVFETGRGTQITTVFTEQPLGLILAEKTFPLTVKSVKPRSASNRAMIQPGWTITMIDEIDVLRGGYGWEECVHFLTEGAKKQPRAKDDMLGKVLGKFGSNSSDALKSGLVL